MSRPADFKYEYKALRDAESAQYPKDDSCLGRSSRVPPVQRGDACVKVNTVVEDMATEG